MPIKNGDTVKVHYRGTLDDGTEFDSSIGSEPLEFTMGEGMLIPGFEKAIMGKKVGDKVTVNIPPQEAYGEKEDDNLITVPLDEVPEGFTPEVGLVVELETEDGHPAEVVITEVTDEHVVLDANHPLAGQTLTFEIEVVEIAKA